MGLILFILVVSGCQTGRPRADITPASHDGAWAAKTLIRDKTKRKSYQLDLDFIARRPSQMRMEATTPGLGIHVASFALNGGHMSYILNKQKKYVEGPADSQAMKSLIQIPLDPRDLVDLLFDRPLSQENWSCSFDHDQMPLLCAHRGSQLRISWADRTKDKRSVQIDAPAARVDMILSEASSKVQVTDALFELTKPEGFGD